MPYASFYDNNWYYFGLDGIMYKNQITPDGYIVNGNGEWVQYIYDLLTCHKFKI